MDRDVSAHVAKARRWTLRHGSESKLREAEATSPRNVVCVAHGRRGELNHHSGGSMSSLGAEVQPLEVNELDIRTAFGFTLQWTIDAGAEEQEFRSRRAFAKCGANAFETL